MNESAALDPMIGVVVADAFVIRRKLAEGGMGAVYIAEHRDEPQLVKVVKVLLSEFTRMPQIRERFLREAKAAARVKDRTIVPIDSFGTLGDGQLYLMMPLLQGETLEDYLKKRARLPLQEACWILILILRALHRLHQAGIVHRDLKPSNLFVVQSEEGELEIVLIDLGIAHDAKDQAASFKTSTGMTIGTPGYCAVEQYGDAAHAAPSADLYSAAIIAWEMLAGSGRLPWGIYPPAVMFHKQMTEVPAPPQDGTIPPEIYTLLLVMLATDPGRRLQNARELAVQFASLVRPMPPRWPGGADMIDRLAPMFRRNASLSDETLRARGGTPAPDNGPITPVSPAALAAAGPPTAYAKPVHPQRDTTLGASSGVLPAQSPRQKGRAGLIVGGIAVAAVAAAVVFFATRQLRPSGSPGDAGIAVATAPGDAAKPHAGPPAVAPVDAAVVTAKPIDAAVVATVDAGTGSAHAPVAANVGSAVHTVAPPPSTQPHVAVAHSATPGSLEVISKPTWSIVEIDGKNVGSTPYTGSIAAGRHRVHLSNSVAHKDETFNVVIEPGKTKTIEKHWQ